ncbi:hypothetical protein pb186bvf_000775 [Paramecium bursaria]
MNRVFGTTKPAQPAPQPAAQQPPPEAPKPMDLTDQQKRMDIKVKELTETIQNIDKDITEQYNKSRTTKGVVSTTAKQRACMLLKKKKMYEQQLGQLLNNQFTLDQIAFTKENITNTMEMAQAMKQQVDVQKQMFKDIDMDKLDDIMDDMEDMKFETEYMNDMMNRNYSCDVDEGELDREMQEIEADMQLNNYNPQQQKQQQQLPAYYSNLMQGQQQQFGPQTN